MNMSSKKLHDDPYLVFNDSSFQGVIRLTPDAALRICDLATEYGFCIDWYECGIWHDDKQGYEGHDVWGETKKEIESSLAILKNNIFAKENINCDIEDGYNAFELCVKRL